MRNAPQCLAASLILLKIPTKLFIVGVALRWSSVLILSRPSSFTKWKCQLQIHDLEYTRYFFLNCIFNIWSTPDIFSSKTAFIYIWSSPYITFSINFYVIWSTPDLNECHWERKVSGVLQIIENAIEIKIFGVHQILMNAFDQKISGLLQIIKI